MDSSDGVVVEGGEGGTGARPPGRIRGLGLEVPTTLAIAPGFLFPVCFFIFSSLCQHKHYEEIRWDLPGSVGDANEEKS